MNQITLDRSLTYSFLMIVFVYILSRLEDFASLTFYSRYIFISFILFLFLVLLFKDGFKVRKFLFFIPVLLFELIYLAKFNGFPLERTFFTILHQTIFFIMLYIVTTINWKKGHIQSFSLMALGVYPFLLILNFIRTDVINTNTIGGYGYFLAFFPLLYLIGYSSNLRRVRITFIVILSSIIIYFSDTRSVFIAVAFSLLTYLLWKLITAKKVFYYLYFFLILSFNYFVIVLYPQIYKLKNFEHYNYLSLKYTGKRLLSGRNQLWESLIEFVKIKPYFGYGAGAVPEDFIETSLSAHNLYIQVSLQVGVVGLSLLLLFLFFIWRKLWIRHNDPKIILVSCYFIGILVYQLFEVTLTQNNMGLAILQWLILGLGLSYCYNSDNPRTS